LLPDTRLNTLTLLGTAEQIAMAEALIPVLDRKVPQVILEASLIEISEDGQKELGFSSASNRGRFSTGTNNSPLSTNLVNRAFSNTIGRTTDPLTPLESIMQWSTAPRTVRTNYLYQIVALITKSKAKLLANPTVVTASDNEAIISIVDDIIRSVTVTQGAFGSAPQLTTNIGEAGIVLNILPKVGANNTVSLRVRPIISTVARTERDRTGNIITLLSRREALAQSVQVQDGETFILGGLIHNTNTEDVTRNPMLSKLPILGALARNSTNNKHRSELVVMITPHIVKDDAEIGRHTPNTPGSSIMPATLTGNQTGSNNNGNTVPVSLKGSGRQNALPALEDVHPIGQETHLNDPLENKPMAKPSPKPFGSLLQSEMMPAPKQQSLNTQPAAKTTMAEPTMDVQSYLRAIQAPPPAEKPASTPAARVPSDEAIRAIIEKFKSPTGSNK
jgi:type II secretory pathway component GspD/PulD (secretin)